PRRPPEPPLMTAPAGGTVAALSKRQAHPSKTQNPKPKTNTSPFETEPPRPATTAAIPFTRKFSDRRLDM
ncbi:MAG: hypothetical protein KDA68_23370, partial [Planctomycetaceae bacterium]|nr:hypothetical protein [Planctomycetaceae bacterium]